MSLEQYLVPCWDHANICFTCRRACGGYSWSEIDPATRRPRFEPIPGWTAEPSRHYLGRSDDGEKMFWDTWNITSCPLYQPARPAAPKEALYPSKTGGKGRRERAGRGGIPQHFHRRQSASHGPCDDARLVPRQNEENTIPNWPRLQIQIQGGRGTMTNFELITQNPQTLDDFLSAVQDDALEAEGCSLYLRLPPNENEDSEMPRLDWQEWLAQEANDDVICLPNNREIDRW